jgi:cell division protein FtsW
MFNKKRKINIFQSKDSKQTADKALIFVILIILTCGLIGLSSASSVVSYARFNDEYYFLKHQLFGTIIGLIAFWIFSQIDYHIWRKYAFGFLIFSIFLLLLVFIPGVAAEYGTSRSWINLFGYSIQPSEFVKLSFLLYLAAWLETRKEKLHDINQGIGPFIVVLGIIAILMLLQPDVGTLSIIAITSLIVYFVGGGKITHLIVIVLGGVLALSILIQFNDYQMNRFRCLLNPEFSPNKYCYQVNQSLIAVGSGGILGRGLGESRQKFMYLPGVKDDFIFAIIAEETGLIVSVLLLTLYLYFFYLGISIAKRAPDDFGKILAIGIVTWIVIQALINVGGIVNILPMTGVPLPLISYGGTAILAALSACGVLVNISKQTKNS